MDEENNPAAESGASSPEIAEALASISSDLFGGGEDTPSSDDPAAASPAPSSDEAPSPPPPEPEIPLPKAWKAEKEPLWKKLDKETREYLTAREADMVKGLSSYSDGHKNWNETIKPFQNLLAQYPDVNPVTLLQQLAKNHLALVQAPPEQKKTMAQNFLKGYGVELSPAEAQAVVNKLPPEFTQLANEVVGVKQSLQAFKQAQYDLSVQEHAKNIELFAKDPKNKYFEEVGDDIVRFLKNGAAENLAAAYDLACWANPVVRAKLIKDQQSAAAAPKVPKPTNLNGSGEGTPSSRRKASIDDTIDSVVSKHYPSH
jgi:hypothetical protein